MLLLSAAAVHALDDTGNPRIDGRLQFNFNAVQARGLDDRARAAAIKQKWDPFTLHAKTPDRLRVRVDAKVTPELLDAIRATGAEIIHVVEQWNSVAVDATPAQIDALGALAQVNHVGLQMKPRRRIGTTTTQGDVSHRADQVRALGITGAGQRVGVISDSVNITSAVGAGHATATGTPSLSTLTGTNPQNTGDLPPEITVVNFGHGDPDDDDTDEGEGMLEIVHDLAPGAELSFGSADDGEEMFADSITKLRTLANCTVTCDDIGYFAEPYFVDGPIAKAISQNKAYGVSHFSAAGNDYDQGAFATYVDVNPNLTTPGSIFNPSRNNFHNWGINSTNPELLPIVLPAAADSTHPSSLLVILQWDQPYSSYGLGAGAQVDLNMYLYSGSSFSIVDGSIDHQGTTGEPFGDPFEIVACSNTSTSSSLTVRLGVDRYTGAAANFRVVVLGEGLSFPQGIIGGTSMYGHPTSADCIAVGAVPYFNAPATGAVGAPEDFTSRGGVGANGVLFLNPNGTFGRRDKPEIAGIDGANTAFFPAGAGNDGDADGHPNFFGTSAAAPHVAAIAALIQSRAVVSPAQLLSVMQATARDVTVSPAAPGFDDRTGAGLVDALAAINALPHVTTDPVSQIVNAGAPVQFTVTATGTSLQYQWLRNGTPISGATAPAYQISATAFVTDDSTNYQCIVSNSFGKAFSIPATLMVLSAPVIVTPPSDAIVNIGTPASFKVVAVGTGVISYQWKRGATNILNANSATYTIPVAALSDDGALFSCMLTNSVGPTTTAAAALIINTAPHIDSPPIPTPNPSLTGQIVSFTVGASDPQNQALTVVWNFGDSGSGLGSSSTHVYETPGTFNGTVRVTDPLGLSDSASFSVLVILDTDRDGIPDSDDPDDDNDGVSDELEALAGSSPLDKNSTPFGTKAAISSATLDGGKITIRLNFKKPLHDSITLTGTVPIPENFVPLGEHVTVNVGGVMQAFDLDKKGTSLKIPQGSFKATFKTRKGIVAAQIGKYTLKLVKGTFAEPLADEDLTDVTVPIKKEARQIRVLLFFAEQILDQTRALIYTARPGTGSAK